MVWRPDRPPKRSAKAIATNRARRLASTITVGCVLIAALSGCGGAGVTPTPTPPMDSSASPTLATTEPAVSPPPGAEVGAVIWTSAVDPGTNAPTSPVDAFSIDTLTLYAAAPVRNLPPNAVLAADWMYNETSLDAFTTRVVSPMGVDEGWVEFHLTRSAAEPWPDGNYAIAISFDGAVVQTADIPVERR